MQIPEVHPGCQSKIHGVTVRFHGAIEGARNRQLMFLTLRIEINFREELLRHVSNLKLG